MDNLDLAAVPNGKKGSKKSSPSTVRLNKATANISVKVEPKSSSTIDLSACWKHADGNKYENISYNQRAGYQSTGLSTYDLRLTFQIK